MTIIQPQNQQQQRSSELLLTSIRDETNPTAQSVKLAPSVIDSWQSLAPEVRAALVEMELLSQSQSLTGTTTASFSSSSNHDASLDNSEQTSCEDNDNNNNNKEIDVITGTLPICLVERDNVSTAGSSCVELIMQPLERAPKNVFSFSKTSVRETTEVTKTAAALVTRKTSIVTRTRGWRNVFTLPMSYDVNVIPYGTILDPTNPQLLDATGPHHKNHHGGDSSMDVLVDEEGCNRRFAVIDDAIEKLYGTQIRHYFTTHGIALTTCVLSGGEADKRPAAVDQLIDELCRYKLRRREPFLAIGGGVLLDIAGMAACLYRRGVPFVRVPTTLLAIVDASVGVKNGVDYCCQVTDETYKNRIGSFYAPSSCLLDPSFITTQDERNVSNGFGEIIKLALVRSEDLFELLETYGMDLVRSRFAPTDTVPEEVATRVIDLSIQIMLEELGPNLWETKLERCVDYGHTFSKLLEMVPGVDIMHGEAVNVDGFFCCILSYLRGYISMATVQRIFNCMKSLQLPTNSVHLQSNLAWQSCKDAVEHRHGEQRIPLITDIGESICVSDITPEELDRALNVMKQFDH